MTAAALRIALCGPGEATPDELAIAEQIGYFAGSRGAILICGGLEGAMAAACRGAKRAGGTTIGILPGYDPAMANPWVDIPICTGMGQARNVIIVASAGAVIAAGGGFGTLSEIALALRLGRPVVLVGGWSQVLATPEARQIVTRARASLVHATTPEEAIEHAIRLHPSAQP
ncbi:MAG: TIGR00725 family protein [Thermomicrobiales bacterium]|nr:MAG: TIGR00725 family protein [Thermomicrobiales bacterium]